MSAMQPIETHYAGCRFRSRLEARWAVFFDAHRWSWEHEPQGFAVAGGYLPDFRVWGHGYPAVDPDGFWYFEIKPPPVVEVARDVALTRLAYLREQNPRAQHLRFALDIPGWDPLAKPALFAARNPIFVVGEIAQHAPVLELYPGPDGFVCIETYTGQDWLDGPPVQAARSARFDHGERPWP